MPREAELGAKRSGPSHCDVISGGWSKLTGGKGFCIDAQGVEHHPSEKEVTA